MKTTQITKVVRGLCLVAASIIEEQPIAAACVAGQLRVQPRNTEGTAQENQEIKSSHDLNTA